VVVRTREKRLGCCVRVACIVTVLSLTGRAAAALDLPSRPIEAGARNAAVDGSAIVSGLRDNSFDVNGTFSPFGNIDESGFRTRLSASASWYRFITNPNPLSYGSGHTVEGSLLAGYQVSLPRVSFIALIGPTVAESDDDGVSATRFGARTAVSMYARPSPDTMAYGSVSYSTIAQFVQFQAKTGLRLGGNFFVGPEVSFNWRNVVPSFQNVAQMRFGGHVSAITFGPAQIGFSAGWAKDHDLGSSFYAGVNAYWSN